MIAVCFPDLVLVVSLSVSGLNVPKVVSLTRALTESWREDCWDGLYKYLDRPSDGDVLFSQFTRPFEVCPCLRVSCVNVSLTACLFCVCNLAVGCGW
jgi:hypothetical protein